MSSLSQLSLLSPAKINLFLHITGKRKDGYHNLQTVFRLLDWGDTLHFSFITEEDNKTKVTKVDRYFNPQADLIADNAPITLTSDVAITENLADNLIFKAAIALIKAVQTNPSLSAVPLDDSLPVVAIKLNKILPTGAGLGGGSSNAATTLLALNRLWGFNLDQQALIDIGKSIGADVPIFIYGKDAIAEGIGEHLIPIDLPKRYYLILNPEAHASTQTLFAHPQLCRDTPSLPVAQIQNHYEGYLDRVSPLFVNAFQPVVSELVPEVAQALSYLQHLESLTNSTARMTGTGSSVFLPIPVELTAQIQTHMDVNPPPCHAVITHSLSS